MFARCGRQTYPSMRFGRCSWRGGRRGSIILGLRGRQRGVDVDERDAVEEVEWVWIALVIGIRIGVFRWPSQPKDFGSWLSRLIMSIVALGYDTVSTAGSRRERLHLWYKFRGDTLHIYKSVYCMEGHDDHHQFKNAGESGSRREQQQQNPIKISKPEPSKPPTPISSLPPSPSPSQSSSNVYIKSHILLIPPNILRLRQTRDPFLDHRHARHEMLLDREHRLVHDLPVRHLFLRFHEPDYGRVEEVLAVAFDGVAGSGCFFGLNVFVYERRG